MAGTLKSTEKGKNDIVNIAIDLLLKIGALFLVIFLCFRIVKPFLSILLWGLIIAIILFPLFQKLNQWFGKRYKLSSLMISLVALSLLVLPSIWLVNQLVDGVRFLADQFMEGNLIIPVPSQSVEDWPLIGPWLYENWMQLSQNFGESVKGFMPQITTWGERILGAFANTGIGILQFAVSIVIAGIFLVFFEKGSDSGKRIFNKIAGDRGEEFLGYFFTHHQKCGSWGSGSGCHTNHHDGNWAYHCGNSTGCCLDHCYPDHDYCPDPGFTFQYTHDHLPVCLQGSASCSPVVFVFRGSRSS